MIPNIDPRMVRPSYVRLSPDLRHRVKFYCGLLMLGSARRYTLREFRTASGALAYASRLHARWLKMWNAIQTAEVVSG